MLRRFKSDDPLRIFPDSYWQWYMDSYTKIDRETTIKHTAFAPIKYNDKSHSVTCIQKYFKHLQFPVPSTNCIIALLKSPFCRGDVIKTFYLVRIFQLCESGLFLTNSSRDKFGFGIRVLGCENWDNVMCYMDALLFSMFGNLESFEPILFISNTNNNVEVDQLRALLRVYVSLLRSGNLITTDITVRLCELLAKLGFKEAISHRQQDAAALFEFLTECLNMPLLTFKIDIKHGGKYNQNDDEKFSRERILFVSIPEEEESATKEHEETKEKQEETASEKQDPTKLDSNESSENTLQGEAPLEINPDTQTADSEEKSSVNPSEKSTAIPDPSNSSETNGASSTDEVLLEECLEHYFNNSINVERELERELVRRASILSLNNSSPIPASPLGDVTYSTIPEGEAVTTTKPSHDHIENVDDTNTSTRVLDRSESFKTDNVRTSVRLHRSSTLSIWSLSEDAPKKQVSLPAWMFLRLLPFYTDDNNPIDANLSAKNSLDFANRKPILPICLKRYQFNNSTAIRSQKRIIIPPVINLPNFVVDDIDEENLGFKLILESAICHRGNSISSGHFVSVIRKQEQDEAAEDEEDDDDDEKAYNAKWYLYDDMRKHRRVVEKTFGEVFSTEWPYMLFYRLVPIEKPKNPFANANSKNPFIVPKGASASPGYWEDSTLKPPTATTMAATASSVPIPDIAPIEGKYVDVRDKYYWYVLDEEKNYYKEELTTDMNSPSNNSTIGLSPQFRRNSQWSNSSNISSIRLDKQPEIDEKLEPFPEINQSDETFWHKLTRSSTKVDSNESLEQSPTPVPTVDNNNEKKPTTQPEVTTAPTTEPKKKRHFHSRDRKKSINYQREKCTIV
ncbi:hypothetical protein JA1_001586 [Spathaspora sp. JA1]|nr:hypothetical protein JA1_001586 [Spathaspora sp. JA1]